MADGDVGNGPYNPAGYIRSLIADGVGPTAGLRAFREDDGRINDGRWFNLYREVNDALNREPQWLGLDPTSLPGPGEYSTFAAGQGGKYVTTVEMQMIDRGTGLWFTQKTEFWTDEPHTPEEAEADALASWADPDAQRQYEVTVVGAVAVHLWQTVARGTEL